MLKISAFYLDKQKSFFPKKNVPWIALISAKRWRLDVLTFLIHGFGQGLYEYMNIILFEKADEVTFSKGFIIMPVNLQNHKDNAKCSVRTSILYPSVLPPAF
jgi:hypothetical protein